MRLFVAARPPEEALAALATACGRRPDPQWHLTVAFLGERPDPEPLGRALVSAAGRHTGLELQLAGGGTFGGRVLWAGVAGDVDALRALASDVRRELAVAEERPFHPHLTLARGRGLAVPAGLAGHVGPRWPLTGLELVRSRLGRSGAAHEVLVQAPLG